MEISRSSTPEAPPQDLWSSILDSVSSSRSTPSKQILILGQPSTGKSTLATALLQKPVADEGKDDQRIDFSLGYDFADVRDDADEGAFCKAFAWDIMLNVLQCRHTCATIGLHCTVRIAALHGTFAPFSSSSCSTPPYTCHDCLRLDTSMDICGGTANMVAVGRKLDKGRWFPRARHCA